MIKKNKGFTLIEVMVVIVIIGILATLALVAYMSALKRARDTRRIGDMQDISKAQEQKKATDSSYATASGTCTGTISDLVVPSDPGSLSYSCYATANAFCISAELENTNNGNCSGCTSTAAPATTTKTDFCITNKQ